MPLRKTTYIQCPVCHEMHPEGRCPPKGERPKCAECGGRLTLAEIAKGTTVCGSHTDVRNRRKH